MMNKHGFELSIGMVVTLILTILIFSLSVYFLFNWFGKAKELQAEIDRQTKEQIMTALTAGNQLVAIPIAIQQTKRGSWAAFGVGVRNIASETQFSMSTRFSGAYTPDGREICRTGDVCADYIQEKWLGNFATTPTFTLKKNEQKIIPLPVKAELNIAQGTQTTKGDYVFNVCVYDKPLRSDGAPPWPCTIAAFDEDSSVFYTGKIYQVTVKIV